MARDARVEPKAGFDQGESGKTQGNIGIVNIRGVLSERRSFFADTAWPDVREALATFAADDSIGAILLNIDSPGGTVAGTEQTAALVRRIRDSKPVFARVNNMAASAAYWVASQAETISAGPTAEVGSIGVVATLVDFSGAMKKMGVKVIVVASGPSKVGDTDAGAEIPKRVIDEMQVIVDDLAGIFQAQVADGRGMDGAEVKKVADGNTMIATKAVEAGLVDRVEDFGQTIAMIRETLDRSSARRRASARLRLARLSGNFS